MSMHLGGATWAPATKTCSSVACHLAETSVIWGGAPEDYRGAVPALSRAVIGSGPGCCPAPPCRGG